jgi:hypothetical protein
MAGFGLAATDSGSGNATSAFIIQADKFAIVDSSYAGGLDTTPDVTKIPFGIDGTGIYMTGAVRIDGSLLVAGTVTADNLNAATGTFAGALSAATGTFSGSINVNGTSGVAFTNGATTVSKIKLDASDNVLIQSEVSGKTISFLGPSGGGIRIDDESSSGDTYLDFLLPSGGSLNGSLRAFGSSFSLLSYGCDLHLAAGTLGANNMQLTAGSFTFPGSGKLVTCTSTLAAGNSSGNVPVSNGTVNTNLNADMLDGYHSTDLCRIVNGNTGTATASGSGYTMQMGTGLAPTYEVNCSGNNIILQTASDERLKQDIAQEAWGLDFVLQLAALARQFRFRSDPSRLQHGWIAQDVESLVGSDATDALVFTNPNGMKGVNHLMAIAPMTRAIAALHARLTAIGA